RQQFEQFDTDPRTTMDTEFKARQEAMQAQRAQMLEEMEKSAPADREVPAHIAKRIEESQVRRDEMIKAMEVRRAAMQQKMEEYRSASMERVPFGPARQDI
ncbi:MAG: hypothetical protein ABFS39_14645, partial [Pseudomonadota bacterium]